MVTREDTKTSNRGAPENINENLVNRFTSNVECKQGIQLDQHVVELIDLQRRSLFRYEKQGHVADELSLKLHLQADVTIELLRVESTARAGRHFEHTDVVAGCPLSWCNCPGGESIVISHCLHHREIFP